MAEQEAVGGTESLPRKLGEGAMRGRLWGGGSQHAEPEWPGSDVLSPELWKCSITAVWKVRQRGKEPSQGTPLKGCCSGVDER